MNDILSPRGFEIFLSLAVGVVAGVWLVWDTINLIRARKADGKDAIVRDRRFGYFIGMVIGTIGVLGVLKHYL